MIPVRNDVRRTQIKIQFWKTLEWLNLIKNTDSFLLSLGLELHSRLPADDWRKAALSCNMNAIVLNNDVNMIE